jgi:hypothetical protein
MTDPLILTALLTSGASLILSILNHIKKSKCCGGLVEFETRRLLNNSITPTTPDTPPTENTALLPSSAIDIPKMKIVKRIFM